MQGERARERDEGARGPSECVDAQGVSNQVSQASAIPHFHQMRIVQYAESTAFLRHRIFGGYILTLRIRVFQRIPEAAHGRIR